MNYLLRIAVLDNVPEIEITAQEYTELEKARKILSNALAIEAKYDIMIANYLDFEKQILDNIAVLMVRNHTDYSSFFKIRQNLNIRLVNLLTSAKLYIDQLNQNVRECVPNVPDVENVVKEFFSKEYDENKEYRFMEALRNYVQHRGIPVHLTQYGQRWTSLEDNGFLEYNLELASQYSYLKEDSKFKREVLKELDEKVDLKAATRSYIESISNVHESARSVIAKSVTEARELIEDVHYRYAAIFTKSLVGLSAFKREDEGQVSVIPLLLDWDDMRVELQKQNKKLTNLRKRYVTGIIKTHDE